ncbi:hypothetical protein PAMP_004846 [Pampus punctatissimus]
MECSYTTASSPITCPPGTFKSTQGPGLCLQCPSNSRSTAEAATICVCRNGYYRGDADLPDEPCTSVPSSPRNVISIVNETSVILEWHAPRETGGRDDVVYNIVCKKCRADRRSCSHCDDNVDFVPRQLGLTETRVFISNLWAHTLYSFEIQAVNGVSNKSPYPAQHVSIDITTNQAARHREALTLINGEPSSALKARGSKWGQIKVEHRSKGWEGCRKERGVQDTVTNHCQHHRPRLLFPLQEFLRECPSLGSVKNSVCLWPVIDNAAQAALALCMRERGREGRSSLHSSHHAPDQLYHE